MGAPAPGPRVVALGGGHGLAVTLRAVRTYGTEVTAVVSVADDGGSSGRLRQDLGIPPPGDLRRCLTALCPDHSAAAQALEYRFPSGDLAGHAVGNLLIAGLTAVLGDFVAALDEAGRLIGSRGRVLPAAVEPVTLTAAGAALAGGQIEGQVAVQNTRGVRSVRLRPVDPATPPAVIEAIAGADQVVMGPGSLFTSVLAAALVPGVRRALSDSRARKVYVCNLGPQIPETEGMTAADHAEALLAHEVPVDVVLCHDRSEDHSEHGDLAALTVPSVIRDVARPDGRAHDPVRLAAALVELL